MQGQGLQSPVSIEASDRLPNTIATIMATMKVCLAARNTYGALVIKVFGLQA
jgi:hypothetical protein